MTQSSPDDDLELPELTLSLRRFGSHRGGSAERATGAEQDRFFAPLLDARRKATPASTMTQTVMAFDARRLTAAMDATLRAFTSERHAASPPARRALEAELLEIVEPLRVELLRLRHRADDLLAAPGGAERSERWRQWLEQLRAVFRSADGTWPSLERALLASPGSTATRGGRRK